VPGGTPATAGETPALPNSKSGAADILRAILHQTVLLNRIARGQEKLLQMGLPGHGNSEIGKQKVKIERRGKHPPPNGKHGRFRFENGFLDVWLGGEHYDLRGRAKARFCIQYLVAKQAFNADSARHLEHEIDPFVRKKCQLPPPSEIRIQHYFNDRSGKLSRLRGDLVKAAGRNGRFYLRVV
jgi:hypothetical protein